MKLREERSQYVYLLVLLAAVLLLLTQEPQHEWSRVDTDGAVGVAAQPVAQYR